MAVQEVTYDVGSGSPLTLGNQYDHNAVKITFEGFNPVSSSNTVYFKFQGIGIYPLLNMTLTVQQAFTKRCGISWGQLAEIASNGSVIQNSDRFKVIVNDSVDEAVEIISDDADVDLWFTQMNELYNKVKSDWDDFDELVDRVDNIENISGAKIYGVTGILNASPTLTRTKDAVGMVAKVGTDGDNSKIVNDFDSAAPFMRRKCVGRWNNVLGKAVFSVNSYYGDSDYAEDGSKGDYVAVECPKSYFKMQGTVLEISAYRHEGFRPFDIFCVDHNPANEIPVYYLPAYALATKDGHAVSLPGLDNEQGSYKVLLDAARTYGDGSLGNLPILQPAAVNFYEWALFTVEFATNNCQSIMYGCASLRSADDDRVTFKDATHVLTNNYSAARVAGEYIAITPSGTSHTSATYKATHKILSVTRCDESGTANSSGSYQLLGLEDLGKDYLSYELGVAYSLAARPYRTGACNSVSTPSGSPKTNTNGYYPMKYRWRENIYGNQYKTCVDLFDKRVGTSDGDYKLEWYYLEKPSEYVPSTTSKPDATDLATDLFKLLDVSTEHDNYANGYVKTKKYSDIYSNIWIPFLTTGGSGSTYFCDYAYLVNSNVVRSIRFGGLWSNGAAAGFSFANANYAPSNSNANYGGDL